MVASRRTFCLLPALLLACLAAGCSSLQLYSETRDKQGQEAKAAWSKVDLAGVIEAERQNLDKLLQEELKTQDLLAAGIRDNRLRALVEAKRIDRDFSAEVESALTGVAGSAQLVEQSRSRYGNQQRATAQLQGYGVEFVGLPIKAPACSEVKDGTTPKVIEEWKKKADRKDVGRIDAALTKIQVVCNSGFLKPLYVYTGLGGSIATAVAQYNADAGSLAAAKAAAAPLRKRYEDAAAAYRAAIERSTVDSKSSEEVSAALTNLAEAAKALDAAQDPFSAELISSERLKAIGAFADAASAGKPGDKMSEDERKAVLAFVLIPELLDEARESLASAKKPLAVPLFIRSNHERLKLQAATKEIEARDTMVRLSKEALDTQYEMAVQLWLASNDLNSTEVRPLASQSATSAFLKGPPDARERLFMAAVRYLDAVDRLSARRYKLEYMRIALSHQLALSYAETSVQQWGSLIGTTVDQVAAANASGIKAENISALINALGVVWIGHGVNK